MTESERSTTQDAPEQPSRRRAQRPRDGMRKPPSLARQAWNLAQSLADFVADGCTTVSEEQYRQRLKICDTCPERRNNRCMKCGCRLSLKARGRAFKCPEEKWPSARENDFDQPASGSRSGATPIAQDGQHA